MNEHWQLFVALLGVVTAWGVLMAALFKVMFSSSMKSLEGKIDEKIKGIETISDNYKELSGDLNDLKRDLPLEYVRREDFIRFDLTINTKLDKLRDLVVEALQNRGKRHE